ncbi:YgiW/YdeI family stress tolerance OB fold protein [Symbiopectobacterium sp. Eva_TO]
MKRTFIALLLGAVSVGAVARQGGFVAPNSAGTTTGGFKGPEPGLTTVEQAKTLRDDAWVVLEGHLVRQLGHKLYEFRDSSGTVNVDIDDKRWVGQTVTPNDKIRIEGEVDKDWNSVEIDVKSVHLVK